MGRVMELLGEIYEVFLGRIEDFKGYRISWYIYIFFIVEVWFLVNIGGFREEVLVIGIRLEDGFFNFWILVFE